MGDPAPPPPRLTSLDRHDTWNLCAIGGLNVAHCAWWCSVLPERLNAAALQALFCADVSYILGDFAWIALDPGCVPLGARPALLMHHALTVACAPVAFGRPVLMAHLLRAWIVELHSWNHIAARQLSSPRLRKVLQAINKPLFVAARLIGFPLTYVAYARDRRALDVHQLLLQAPLRLHGPLSVAHAAMYGLMIFWGYRMFWPRVGRNKKET